MTFSIATLIDESRQAGLYLEPRPDGRLYVEPVERLTPELKTKLLRHKAEILAYLRQPSAVAEPEATPPAPAAKAAPPRRSRPKTVYWTPAQLLTLVNTVTAQLPAGGQKSHKTALDLSLAWLELQHQIRLGDA